MRLSTVQTPTLAVLATLLLWAALTAATAQAQSATAVFAAPATVAIDLAPTTTSSSPTPATTSTSTPSGSSSSSSSSPTLPTLSQGQANGLFDGFLLHGFESATDGIRRGLQGV